jgi:mono/diheme cytochrome c family protein
MRTVCVGLMVVVLALAGCGGDDDEGGSADTGTTTQEQTTTETQPTETTETSGGDDAQAAAGKEVFTSNCGGCHTLADAGTNGQQGPNLDEAAPSEGRTVAQVKNGGGGMPPFGDRLSAEQIEAVAAYVSSVAGQ